MEKINQIRHTGKATGTFIVAVDNGDAENIQIFANKSEESVIMDRWNIIKKCFTREEAEKELLRYENRNTTFIVRKIPTGIELIKHKGVITTAPIGTIGIFRKKKQAKKFYYELKRKMKEETEKASQTTAVA